MKTRTIISIAGLVLALSIPNAVLAKSVGGFDWDTEDTLTVTKNSKQIKAPSTVLAKVGIGMDWDSEDDLKSVKHGVSGHIHPIVVENTNGKGTDWDSEGICLAQPNFPTTVNNC